MRRFRLGIAIVCVLALMQAGCAFFEGLFGPKPLYEKGAVPAQVFDAHVLSRFQSLTLTPPPGTRVTLHDSGKVEPDGPLSPGDYQPQSYGRELYTRLDLRSFPSMAVVPDYGKVATAAGLGWKETGGETTGCALNASYLTATFKMVATYDYRGTGRRDWLLVATMQPHQEQGVVLILWLVVENPRAEGPLIARLVALEERRGLGGAGIFTSPEAARAHLAALRAEWKYPPLPE